MSLETSTATQAIFNAIDEINLQLPEDKQIPKSDDAILFAEGGNLDSLGLVNLVIAAEQHIMDLTGDELVLASETAMSRKRSPYRSVSALAEYAVEVANQTEESAQ